jgi:hypothetical protein
MRKLKKFKRFSEGGLGSSEGEGAAPIFTNKTEFDPERRERAMEGIKNFFMGRRSKDEPSAPIEERQPPKKAAEEDKATAPAKAPAKPEETAPVVKPSVQSTAVNRGETSYDYPTQRDSKRDDYEGSASPTSGGQTFKRAAPKPRPAAPKEDTSYKDIENARGNRTKPSAPAKAPIAASPNQIPGTDVKTPYEGEKIDNRGLAAKQLAQSTLGATAVGRGLGAGIRGAMGLGRMFESATKPEGKGTGKFPEAKPEIEVSTKPAVDRLKEANIQGPPKPPRQETATEKMGVRDTPSMVRMREAKESAAVGPKPAPKEAPKAKSTADDEVAQEAAKRAAASRPRVTPKRQEDSSKFGGGKGTPSKAKTRAEVKPTSKKLKNPVGEKEGPTVDKVLESKGLSAKKGGKIPAFKKGGFVSRGDGCAQRGKTKGRMM